ncbi:hypothetical protein V3C99_018723 [Haemonchus contortus]
MQRSDKGRPGRGKRSSYGRSRRGWEEFCKARRSAANYKTKMTSLRRPDLRQDKNIAPSVLPSKIRHAITSIKKCTAPGPDEIKPKTSEESATSNRQDSARLLMRYLQSAHVVEN